MKPMIDIHNYEAFYLDYLEGTLDNSTAEMLEGFLAEHPELVVDDFEMVLPESTQLDSAFKQALKQDSDIEVTLENLDYLLIAELEGQLTDSEISRLHAFLNANPELWEERQLVQRLILEPGTAAYPHKDSLKKRGLIIPLWTRATAAAAIILLFCLPFLGTVFSDEVKSGPVTAGITDKPVSEPQQNQSGVADSQQTSAAQTVTYPKKKDTSGKERLIRKEVVRNPRSLDELTLPVQKIESDSPQLALTTPAEQLNSELAAVTRNSQMENPIPVITRSASEVFKTPIDVKTEKAGSKKGKGFYVRIGNVEVSRSASL